VFGVGSTEVSLILIILLLFFLWIYAILDLLRSDYPTANKIIIFLLLIFLPVIGIIVHFLYKIMKK